MIAITKIGTDIKDKNNSILEVIGLSTDTKPTENISNGSIFIEMDTGKIYFYDKENTQWREF